MRASPLAAFAALPHRAALRAVPPHDPAMLIIWLVSWSPGASAGTQITAIAKARGSDADDAGEDLAVHPEVLGQHDRRQHAGLP